MMENVFYYFILLYVMFFYLFLFLLIFILLITRFHAQYGAWTQWPWDQELHTVLTQPVWHPLWCNLKSWFICVSLYQTRYTLTLRSTPFESCEAIFHLRPYTLTESIATHYVLESTIICYFASGSLRLYLAWQLIKRNFLFYKTYDGFSFTEEENVFDAYSRQI